MVMVANYVMIPHKTLPFDLAWSIAYIIWEPYDIGLNKGDNFHYKRLMSNYYCIRLVFNRIRFGYQVVSICEAQNTLSLSSISIGPTSILPTLILGYIVVVKHIV